MANQEQKGVTELTPKQIGIILAVIVTVAGGIPTGFNKLTPDARSKPFTSDDGLVLDKKIKEQARRCEEYRNMDQLAMENVRTRLTKLETLIDMCLDEIN